MRKLLAELESRIALTWDEYSKAHPRTKKTPSDPLFTKPGTPQAPKQPLQNVAPTPKPEVAPSKTPAKTPVKKPSKMKTLDQLTDDEVLDKFRPALKPGKFQRKMSVGEFGKNVESMSEDDVAWHVLNSSFADDLDSNDRVRWAVNQHFSMASRYAMTLLNPNISKKDKDDTASYLLDKAGVSFVSSRALKKFLEVCGKKGLISKDVWKSEEDSDKERDESDAIGSTYTAQQLLKLSPKKVEEEWKEVCQNDNLPPQLIARMLKDKEVIRGMNHMGEGFMNDSGLMVGVADRKHAIGKAQRLLQNKNVPFEVLKSTFSRSLDKMISENNHKAHDVAKYLGNHPDINKPANKEIRDKVVSVLSKAMQDIADREERMENNTSWSSGHKYGTKYKPSAPPENLRLSPEEFRKMWAARSAGGYKYQNDGWFAHPDMPNDVVGAALKLKDKKNEDYIEVRRLAFKKAMERKLIPDATLVTAVKTNLNLQSDDIELVKKFAEHAFAMGKGTNDVPRYLTKADDTERKKVEAQMRLTAFHDEFDYEVSAVYHIDKEPHKDYETRSKELGNVVEGIYHGTSYANAGGILSDGVRVDTEARTGSMFGRGFYLASASSKAAQYAGEGYSQQSDEGIVFVLNATLGKSQDMKYGRPQNDEMTARNLQPEDKAMIAAYKKKTGKELKDKWHANYDSVTAKAGQALDYDEYVVKDPSQIQIKRVVIVKKTPKAKK